MADWYEDAGTEEEISAPLVLLFFALLGAMFLAIAMID